MCEEGFYDTGFNLVTTGCVWGGGGEGGAAGCKIYVVVRKLALVL